MRLIGLAVVFGLMLVAVGAEGQEATKAYRVGILWPAPAPSTKPFRDVLVQALREFGRIEGQNIVVEERYSGGNDELLGDLAANLVAQKVDVLVTPSDRATRAARQATTTIPIAY